MKRGIHFIALFIFILTIANINAQEKKSKIPKSAEINYLKCLESNIEEVKISAIFYLGEIKSESSVGNLIYILRYDKNFAARLVSALSLIKIGDSQGIAEVKKIPTMTPSQYTTLEDHVSFLSMLWDQYLTKNPNEAIALKNIKFEYKSVL